MEEEGKKDWSKRKKRLGIYIVVGLIFISIAFYLSFMKIEKCESVECFKKGMLDCDYVSYMNDVEEATWYYEIVGEGEGSCFVNVRLLQAKVGDLGMQRLEGFDMECEVGRRLISYPEENLKNCHGRLKEEMQGIMIEKLHKEIIENLDEIGRGLNSSV